MFLIHHHSGETRAQSGEELRHTLTTRFAGRHVVVIYSTADRRTALEYLSVTAAGDILESQTGRPFRIGEVEQRAVGVLQSPAGVFIGTVTANGPDRVSQEYFPSPVVALEALLEGNWTPLQHVA